MLLDEAGDDMPDDSSVVAQPASSLVKQESKSCATKGMEVSLPKQETYQILA